MARKTLKKTYRRRHTRKRGGATNKLPGIPKGMKLRDFEAQWDVFYISAHGALLPDLITVPEKSYILNSIPSGEKCTMLVNDERLDRFYIGNDNTPGYEWEFMEFIQDPKVVFPYIYNKVPVRMNYKSLAVIPTVTSIYEPEDAINDILLDFASYVVREENKTDETRRSITHFIVPGIFKLPISKAIKSERDRGLSAVSRTAPDKVEKELKRMNSEFINLKDNLLKTIVTPGRSSFTLSELLLRPELQASEGKKRFIIIHACKSMSGATDEHKLGVRRASIGRIILSENKRLKAIANAASVASVGAIGGPGAAATPVAEVKNKKGTMFGFAPGFMETKKKPTKPASAAVSAVADGK